MRINPLNNINFGYNKSLNKRLEARLAKAEQTPVIRVLTTVNQNCNFVEDQIRALESKDRARTDKNEFQINLLLEYFMDAKTFVATTVERLFPDLNYMKTECDTYDEESMNLKPSDEESDSYGVKRAWLWRDMLVDGLSGEIENFTSYINDPDLEETEEDGDEEVEDITEQAQDEYERYLAEEKQKQAKKSEDAGLEFVEKFTPSKSAPKSLEDVVGLDLIREDVRDLIIEPVKRPNAIKLMSEYGIEIPRFIVFHGPPGCGKTMLAQAIAAETGCEMFSLDLSKFGSAYVNQTSVNISKAFNYVEKQAEKSEKPVILFMDEMDSVLSKRIADVSGGGKEDNKAVNTLLTQIVNAKDKNIIMIGATNMFDAIDPAAKRRIDLNAYVGLPKKEEIAKLLIMQLSRVKKGEELAGNQEAIESLSNELLGYSPSNIVNIVKAAFKIAYKAQREVTSEDVQNAIKQGSWEKVKEKDYMPQNKKPVTKIGFGQ